MREGDLHYIVDATVKLDYNRIGRELEPKETELAGVSLIVCFERTPATIGELELALDEQIGTGLTPPEALASNTASAQSPSMDADT